MMTCRDCGQTHDDVLAGVTCDVRRYGVDWTRERLLRFTPPDAVNELIERAQATEHNHQAGDGPERADCAEDGCDRPSAGVMAYCVEHLEMHRRRINGDP